MTPAPKLPWPSLLSLKWISGLGLGLGTGSSDRLQFNQAGVGVRALLEAGGWGSRGEQISIQCVGSEGKRLNVKCSLV